MFEVRCLNLEPFFWFYSKEKQTSTETHQCLMVMLMFWSLKNILESVLETDLHKTTEVFRKRKVQR